MATKKIKKLGAITSYQNFYLRTIISDNIVSFISLYQRHRTYRALAELTSSQAMIRFWSIIFIALYFLKMTYSIHIE